MTDDIKPTMERKHYKLIKLFEVNDSFILGIYEGKLSDYDILIMYRQKLKSGKRKGKWSGIRTPKHVHWAVDILTKMQSDKELTEFFLEYMLKLWEATIPIKSNEERQSLIITFSEEELEKYRTLSSKGEYSPKFLIALAKLLMLQEKTNRPDAYMFKRVLEKLKNGEDIFSIISAASFSGRKNN